MFLLCNIAFWDWLQPSLYNVCWWNVNKVNLYRVDEPITWDWLLKKRNLINLKELAQSWCANHRRLTFQEEKTCQLDEFCYVNWLSCLLHCIHDKSKQSIQVCNSFWNWFQSSWTNHPIIVSKYATPQFVSLISRKASHFLMKNVKWNQSNNGKKKKYASEALTLVYSV